MAEQTPPKSRLRDRSTGDLLVLLVAGTVCFTVLGVAGTILAIELITGGDADTSAGSSSISDVINTLIGLLAGFLAGRSDSALTIQKSGSKQGEEEK